MSTAKGLASVRDESKDSLPITSYQPILNQLNKAFASGKTLSYEWRVGQLKAIESLMKDNCDEICAAIAADLGRPTAQALLGDVGSVLGEVRFALKNLKEWMTPESKSNPINLKPGSAKIEKQPKGIVLVIGPWNFPFNVTLGPLVGAIAAGCCAIVKPSEMAPACAALMDRLLTRYLDNECFKIIQGGVPETTALLALPFDHIFYTGNSAVGKVVMTAAAKHLTPVTLELGGKSPVIIDDSANLEVTVRRILDGKYFNAGQICVAPDYVLCHKSVMPRFLELVKSTTDHMFDKDPSTSKSFGRIINTRHWDRLAKLLETADGQVVIGGLKGGVKEQKYMPPTVISNPSPTCPVMQEEIFGPILNVLPIDNLDEAIQFVNARERPLALYIFASDMVKADYVVQRTHSGGVCVNDVVMHVASPALPFGGTGASGMGISHGKYAFDEFSHTRTVMYRGTWIDPSARYPPYKDSDLGMMKRLTVGPLVPPGVATAVSVAAVAGGLWVAKMAYERFLQ